MTKSELLLLRQLKIKKYRDRHGLFIAEGSKIIETLCMRLDARYVYSCNPVQRDTIQISVQDMERISAFKTPSDTLAIFKIPHYKNKNILENGWTLVLDGVQNPGNLGSIIRLADWFGFTDVLCSEDTADCFSPKAVQASMGAISGVRILYGNLCEYIMQAKVPIYGLTMSGKSIYNHSFGDKGAFIVGNEGHGLSTQIKALSKVLLCIPHYNDDLVSESLNVVAAVAIACASVSRSKATTTNK